MANKKFITLSWKAGREPVDNMFWCEADYDGAWTNITTVDRIRTRREVIERIAELDNALIGCDFAFSFPKPFIEFLRTQGLAKDWRSLAKSIREDLKKNTDDGVRIWIERMGQYRESNLEPVEEINRRPNYPGDRRSNFRREPPAPYERRSLAERFRRIDMILKRKDPEALQSTLGIRYNKLTARYEFTDSESRGRATLLGIAMLEQLLEAKSEIAVWPFIKPAQVTVIEIFPKMFGHIAKRDTSSLKKFFDIEEDNALYVSKEVRELAYANPQALDLIFALIGMIKAERREDKSLRPMRDYRDYFYENEEVQAEGWAYGIGFKEPEKKQKEILQKQTDIQEEPVPKTITSQEENVIPIEEETVVTEEEK
jgi:hypothetical protein